jgi:hypothetical protein
LGWEDRRAPAARLRYRWLSLAGDELLHVVTEIGEVEGAAGEGLDQGRSRAGWIDFFLLLVGDDESEATLLPDRGDAFVGCVTEV